MAENVFEQFRDQGGAQIDALRHQIDAQQVAYERCCRDLEVSERTIARVLAAVSESDLEESVRGSLVTAVTQLQRALIQEMDAELLTHKYRVLANMLETVVLTRASLEEKAGQLDTFLDTFQMPGTDVVTKTRKGLQITGIVLLISLILASAFVLPMIPFAALFTMLGVGAAYVGALTTTASIVVNVNVVIWAVWLGNQLMERTLQPLCRLMQRHTDEFQAAEALKGCFGPAFFATTFVVASSTLIPEEDNDVSDIERSLSR